MNRIIEEKSQYTLKFEGPAASGGYEEITWYKGSTDGADRIVFYISGTLNYYGDYCTCSKCPCLTSEKGSLNMDTGDFTINSVELPDDGYYYYQFYAPSSIGDTGSKYEYKLDVYGELS